MPIELGQHNLEIQANAERWRQSPLSQKIYRDFYVPSDFNHSTLLASRAAL